MGWGTQDTCEAQDIVILVAGHTEHSLSNKYHIGILLFVSTGNKATIQGKALYRIVFCITLYRIVSFITLYRIEFCVTLYLVSLCIALYLVVVSHSILYHILSHCILYFESHCIALYLGVVSHCIACRESLRADLRVC